MEPNKKLWGLLRRRECLVPSWRGWLALLVLVVALLVIAVRNVYSFLAVNDPLPGGALVVEGWAPDYMLEIAISEFRHHPYDKLYVVGGPVEWGSFLSEYKTYAERGAAVLVKMGLSTNEVQAVPAPWVRQDRTYTAGVCLRNWFHEHGGGPSKVHLLSGGPHARRSRLLFQRALGKDVSVGVTAIPDRDYDPQHWWRSSPGFRNVTDEVIAFAYAKLLFRESKQ